MKSLYFRVFVITIYTIAISSFVGFYIANVYYNGVLKTYHDAKLSKVAEAIRTHIEKHPAAIGDYLQNAATLGYQLYVLDGKGNELLYGGEFGKLDLSTQAKESVMAGNRYHGIAEFPHKPFVASYFENRLSNTVGVPVTAGPDHYALFLRHNTRLQFDELQIFFALMFAFTVLFSIPYFLLSTRYLVQPIISLTEATKRITDGNYHLRLPTGRRDEIGQLALHFQRMAAKLERSDKSKKEFVANVSHEIHTPLASIQGFADSLLQEELDPAQIRHYAAIIGQETRQLAALSKQLLLLSTLENSREAMERRHFPLQPQIRRALQLLEWQLSQKDIAVRMLVPAGLTVYGDEVLLMQVWSNLLSNAVKYIPSDRSIHIKAFKEEAGCLVEISDTGDGIPEEQLPLLFERFYRGDSARQRNEGSTGLGLSIVQKIVHLHGGTIEAESREGVGTLFRVRIPG
ncbi:sensor histidine kinase [Paenibacillus sp. GCM10027627]|uniref:sensor histidine kinase n=1 Tax=unclassified Paenibacillus TaxID=185978 RepID=UPI003633C35C